MSVTAFESHPKANSLHSNDRNLLVQSWYPLVRSADLIKGRAVSVDVMGHSIVVFRNQANELGAVRRQCCHMGGDLSRGRVTEKGIRCPIHSWEFGSDGQRIQTNGQNDAHANACQPSLRCEEKLGIVFAFLGPKVLFDLPEPSESVFQSSVIVQDFDAHYDVPTIFGFDSEHFTTVHHRGVESLQIYSDSAHHMGTRIKSAVDGKNLSDWLMRMVGLDVVDIDIDYWGANMMLGHHKRSNAYAFLTTLPLRDHRMRMFITMMQQRPESGWFQQLFGRLRFSVSQPVIRAFIEQDEAALSGVRFDPQNSYLTNNPGVLQWLQHYETLPKIGAMQIFRAD